MTDREKLIELLKDTRANAAWHHWGYEESADHLIANGVVISNSETPTDKDTNVPTNGDRIRAMTDEELALFLTEIYAKQGVLRVRDQGYEPTATHIKALHEGLYLTWIRWLKQPAEVDNG